ncbi:pentapeptide repeat-containing protein [Agrobacterium sp. NPDC090273]|uniref:pentapeptide repeat-containing protein n=1 Tax=Agrobacterium sp. NPDC090273 TaxID=3363919 RepID=UPI00383A1D54
MASSERLKIRLNDKAGRIAAVAAGIMVTLAMTSHHAGAASCRTDALAGIDWRECNKRLLMLGGSNLDSAMLYGTDFTYTDLRGSTLKGANLEKAKLIRTALGEANLQGANLTKVEAYRSDFTSADATNAKFVNAEMQRAQFEKAKLDGADFTKAELGRADFEGASLQGVKFTLTNLSRARFEGATLGGPVDFSNAFLLLTRIEGVDLSSATGLAQSQIELSCGNDKTKLPAGLTVPSSWPCAEDPEDD